MSIILYFGISGLLIFLLLAMAMEKQEPNRRAVALGFVSLFVGLYGISSAIAHAVVEVIK